MAHSTPHRTRWWAACVVSACLAIAALTLLAAHRSSHTVTAAPDRVAAAASAHATATGAAAAATEQAVQRDILFVGASYTQGLGAQDPHDGYAYLAGRQLGWLTQVDGVSGTGYLNPGPHGQGTFADRIAHLPTAPAPDMVLIQGGRNDTGYPLARLRAAMIHTVDVTRQRFHHAQIIFLGPIPATMPLSNGVIQVEQTLRSVSQTTHVVFIDPIAEHWITRTNEHMYTGAVPGHPDDAGYAYIAHRLAEDLRGLKLTTNA